MVVAGNMNYRNEEELPDIVPVFPLEGGLLLPAGQMPLNIFEPRYIAMVDEALRTHRVIGMIQPSFDGALTDTGESALCRVGCLGRVTSVSETGDGRYIVSLQGIARFRVVEEIASSEPYRSCRVSPFVGDLDQDQEAELVDRERLLKTFRAFLDVHSLEADWASIERSSTGLLVNALSMMFPYGFAEKQALLEAVDLRSRAETLIALTEMSLARFGGDDGKGMLQ